MACKACYNRLIDDSGGYVSKFYSLEDRRLIMSNEEKRSMTFKVQSFRKIPNPYLKSENGEKSAEMYIAICDVKDIPDDIPMETNPREQKMTSIYKCRLKDSDFCDIII